MVTNPTDKPHLERDYYLQSILTEDLEDAEDKDDSAVGITKSSLE
jgi:hypothetical protein